MMDEQIKKDLRIAKAFGRSKGLSFEQVEDFSQEYIIAKYVKKWNQTIVQTWVDFLRNEFGQWRSECGKLKSAARRTAVELEPHLVNKDDDENDTSEISRNSELEKVYALITAEEECILKLRLNGRQVKEIANIFEVSAGRISQRIDEITRKLQTVSLEKPLHVDWISL